jgi:prevent-host-death family protein
MTDRGSNKRLSPAPATLGTAEAKRRFSELVDRVGAGERIVISRRGRPAVALVQPSPELVELRQPPKGLATLAGALAEWDDLDETVEAIYAARRGSADRHAPALD